MELRLQTLYRRTSTTDHETALTTTHSDKRVKKGKKVKKRRPARPQVDPATFKGGELPPQTGTIFNIWCTFIRFIVHIYTVANYSLQITSGVVGIAILKSNMLRQIDAIVGVMRDGLT